MGHTRLGRIPKSQKWIDVVQALSDTEGQTSGDAALATESVEELAGRTLKAAQEYLKSAINDLGLRYTFFLLTRVVIASRREDFLDALGELGIQISREDSLLGFSTEFQGSIDDYLRRNRYSSDVSEIAQQAAGEALSYLVGPRSATLFGASAAELQTALKSLSTKKGFSELGKKFFGTFMARFINFYLSRVTASELGSEAVPHIEEISRFNRALQVHCEQSAQIIRDFTGEWYSKTEYVEGINLANTSGFLAVALKKLQAELGLQEAEL